MTKRKKSVKRGILKRLKAAAQAVHFGFAVAWRARSAIAIAILVGAGVAVGKAMDSSPALLGPLEEAAINQVQKAGLVVDRITVTGLKRTDQEAFLAALDIDFGTAIFPLDLDAARARVEALPWIKTAVVRRSLPDELSVAITERQPYAIWQHDEELELIDPDGTVIPGRDVTEFASLPLIVGQDAPARCPQLFALFATQPNLASQVRAAILVGDRRWDVELRSGTRVMLPAPGPNYGPDAAWARLAALESEQNLLERRIERLDLRLPDRVVLGVDEKDSGELSRFRDNT